jgi:fibronectin type 3 domain-containing protein
MVYRIKNKKIYSWIVLFCTLLSTATVQAGSNAGFSVALEPAQVSGPAVGEQVDFVVQIAGAVAAKHALVIAQYDSTFFEFVEFVPGDLIEALVAPAGIAEAVTGSLKEIQSGGTQLEGTPGAGAGALGTLSFVVVGEIPAAGPTISITQVQINASSSDADTLVYALGELSFSAARRFANKLFNFAVERRHDGADIVWESRWPGVEDTLRYRAVGDSVWTAVPNPLFLSATAADIAAVKVLQAAGVEAETAAVAEMEAVLLVEVSVVQAALYADLDVALRERRHAFALQALAVDTQYEYEAWSTSLSRQFSPVESGLFRTRLAPDLRAAAGTDLDIQTTTASATATWFTNRPADTRFAVALPDSDFVDDVAIYDDAGALVHLAQVEALLPGTEYKYRVGSRLVGVESLITAGLMTEDRVTVVKTGTFRTKKEGVPLRFLGPPSRVISTAEAIISFRLNQVAGALVDYGLVREGDDPDEVIYDWNASSADVLNAHSVTLAGLESSSRYRYRIRVVSPSGDTLSTGPEGDEQWNRDLQLRTSTAGDTLPPVIVEGPVVVVRDVLAIVRFTTDVETKATVFFGTSGGTYGTPDEFEGVDRAPDGGPRFAREHSVTISGLEPGLAYAYGVQVEGANGKSTSFEPNLVAAKRVGVLQPPGGSGIFTTNNDPDTQFPVILSGPAVTSKTHDTAIVEWTTDEPANSAVRFGASAIDEEEGSGTNALSHKLVLSNLLPGTTYRYVVASTDAVGNGATESATSTFTTDREVDLAAPRITQEPGVIYKSDKTATIEWRTDEDAKGVVEFGPTTALGFIRELPSTGQRHEVALTNLSASTTYFYKIFSTDLNNNGPTESAVLQFTTDALADLTSPVVSGIRALAADSTAIVRWDSDELADSFVEFSTDSLLLDLKIGVRKDVLEHELTLTNLTPGTRYYYRVGSTDRANNPPTESAVFSFTAKTQADTLAPSVPFALRATPGARQVLLAWDAELELDLNGFNVYRSAGGDFELLASGLQKTTFTDPNVIDDSNYSYQVTASDRQTPPNESAASEAVAVVPTASAAPSAPSELGRTGDFLRPTFFFTNASPFGLGGELTYTIQVSSRADFSKVTASVSGVVEGAGATGTGQTGWTTGRGLNEGQSYYWRVRAVEGSLVGPFSDAEEFFVANPQGLAGDFNGDGSVLFDDFFLFVDFFGQPAAGAAEPFDLDDNGDVDFGDFFAFVDNFGRSIAGKRWAGAGAVDEQTRFVLEAIKERERGREITLRLWAEEVDAIKAYGAVIEYDPAQVFFEGAGPGAGDFLQSQGGRAPLFGVLSRRSGQVVLGNGLVAGEAVSGQGLLAELRFRLIGDYAETAFALREGYVAHLGQVVRSVAQLESVRVRPESFALYANYPNPFNPSTSIEYALPENAEVSLVVYDIIGQQVRRLLAAQHQAAGFYRLAWDGRDGAGRAVGSGVYFYRLSTAGAVRFVQTRKMTLIK